ncbi:unnamed protein product [Phaeothamnion confervicola]
MPIKIQIFGERCSGTKYLARLLLSNFSNVVITSECGFKHFFPDRTHIQDQDTTSVLFVVIVRDYKTWLRSMWAQPYHVHCSLRGVSFDKFIKKEWRCVYDETAHVPPRDPRFGSEMLFERDPETQERFKNVVEMRSAKMRAFLQLRDLVENYVLITYEELVASPDVVINFMQTRFGLKRSSSRVNLGKRHVPIVHAPLEERHIAHVKKHVDVSIENFVGYEI